MGITSGPKSIRAFQEIGLEHRFQDPRHRSLQQAIFDRKLLKMRQETVGRL